ncbi:Sua5/YciO/YrdC/YwlC family protein [Candidatus Azambacteria bacterium]|nr:Sua5/YciO/YrdC/YwlC family protein [Candidatus Azambacteria bacterium]MBI2587884.1 Sua5/YciO/YrdC/YwlC family protein [Candidatus Azambacteria bacterium]
MRVITLHPGKRKELSEAIEAAERILQSGNIVVVPTDTAYVLAANPFDGSALQRLARIAPAYETKPIPLGLSDFQMAEQFAYLSKKDTGVLEEIWPGPTIAVVHRRPAIPLALSRGLNSVPLRIPDHKIPVYLIAQFGLPISLIPAHPQGELDSRDPEKIIALYDRRYPAPELLLNVGELKNAQSSTILDLTTSQPKIVKTGMITKKELDELILRAERQRSREVLDKLEQ